MGWKQILIVLLTIASITLSAREIVVDVKPVPVKNVAMIFTPFVLPDLISAKAALEYRLHDKFNLVIPVEAKWMDYRKVIGLFDKNAPQSWYAEGKLFKPGWNIDIAQLKISSGLGVKWFPFSESMTNAFFVKGMFLVGFERFNTFEVEGKKDGAVFTQVASIGYNWVKRNRFTFGFEVGQEYSLHTNPIKGMPILIDGFLPFLQMSLGFTI